MKRIIAVFFGGRSVEHDVSVLTGLQVLDAMDADAYEAFPVYIAPDGQWWAGEALRDRTTYPLKPGRDGVYQVQLDAAAALGDSPALTVSRKGLFGAKTERLGFDLAFPALHGTHGEDGAIQGLFDFMGIPYAGSRALGAALAMDKHATKRFLAGQGVKMLPHALIQRLRPGTYPDLAEIEADLVSQMPDYVYPLLVKPRRLGSSIGVGRVEDRDGLLAALLRAFKVDDAALVEPCVPHLVEYNVAVRRHDGKAVASAIERPTRKTDVLDFQTKYLAQGGKAAKKAGPISAGMAGTDREIDPADITSDQRAQIIGDAITAFDAMDLAGTPRVDFLCNGQTGELWLNEVNTIPGSFAFFLWQVAEQPLGFTALASHLIEEGAALSTARRAETGVAAGNARIFQDG